jgi:hypothetical protein
VSGHLFAFYCLMHRYYNSIPLLPVTNANYGVNVTFLHFMEGRNCPDRSLATGWSSVQTALLSVRQWKEMPEILKQSKALSSLEGHSSLSALVWGRFKCPDAKHKRTGTLTIILQRNLMSADRIEPFSGMNSIHQTSHSTPRDRGNS